jgi:hypothetical protein
MGAITVRIPTIRRRGGRKLDLVTDGTKKPVLNRRIDNTMVKAIARAFRWRKLLETGVVATLRKSPRSPAR